MFSQNDLLQLREKGIELKEIERQIETFIKGFPFIKLIAPAAPGNGIRLLNTEEANNLASYYESCLKNVQVLKFVPASGAASRMFSHLFAFRDWFDGSENSLIQYLSDKSFNSPFVFLSRLKDFAFCYELALCLSRAGENIDDLLEKKEFSTILDYLLTSKGLEYAALPKAFLKFHSYPEGNRSALEEHYVEGALYCRDKDNVSEIHFTLSPEHIGRFAEINKAILPIYEKKFGITYKISYSIQKSSTDTIAVDIDNNPFREIDGSLVFRPGGHGALIENLSDLNADVIFIKNIDNVVPDRFKEQTILYKKAIGGHLLKLREKSGYYIQLLERASITDENLEEISTFLYKEFCIDPTASLKGKDSLQSVKILMSLLNKPLRVCGMVRNEGEPGGGPFLVEDSKQRISPQIVESSQVDRENPEQLKIFNNASHFNPVDLVCCFKDHQGNKYDLNEFTDPQTGFISQKSKDGRPLKAMELPGLWNGAMAGWNTVFVEVPMITFNPVKTVNDLLRKEHQG